MFFDVLGIFRMLSFFLITAAWALTVFEAQGGVPATTTEETEDKLDLLEA